MEIGITELHTSFLDSSLHTLIQEPHYSLRICNWPRRENTNKETNLLLQIQCICLIFWEPSDPESYSFFSCFQKLDNARTRRSYSLSHTVHILTWQPRKNMNYKQSLLLYELQIGDVASNFFHHFFLLLWYTKEFLLYILEIHGSTLALKVSFQSSIFVLSSNSVRKTANYYLDENHDYSPYTDANMPMPMPIAI
jgi:hypothetical protein